MAHLPVPPIFSWEPDDLTAFETLEAASAFLEPIDVQAGALEVYDAEGFQLMGIVERDTSKLGTFFGRTLLKLVRTERRDLDRLRSILTDFLALVHEDGTGLSWPDLIEHALKHAKVRAWKPKARGGRAR